MPGHRGGRDRRRSGHSFRVQALRYESWSAAVLAGLSRPKRRARQGHRVPSAVARSQDRGSSTPESVPTLAVSPPMATPALSGDYDQPHRLRGEIYVLAAARRRMTKKALAAAMSYDPSYVSHAPGRPPAAATAGSPRANCRRCSGPAARACDPTWHKIEAARYETPGAVFRRVSYASRTSSPGSPTTPL